MGLLRHLTPGEIVGQILVVLNDVGSVHAGSTGVNVVLMGMGEPLHNYDHTVAALVLMADIHGMAISPKPITRRWPMQELLDTCRDLALPPGRRITFEYVLIAGVNDTLDDARRLTKLL